LFLQKEMRTDYGFVFSAGAASAGAAPSSFGAAPSAGVAPSAGAALSAGAASAGAPSCWAPGGEWAAPCIGGGELDGGDAGWPQPTAINAI